MDSFDPVERAEATERISIDGDEALVYHAQNPDLDPQAFADLVHEMAESHEFEEPDRMTSNLLEDAPDIVLRVHRLTQTDFTMEFHDRDDIDTDLVLAVSDTFNYFSYDPDDWHHSRYSQDDPTTAEVIAAFVSLVNAAWCVNNLENMLESREGVEPGGIFSEAYFNVNVTKGLMLAFRDAFAHHVPKSAIQGMYFHESDRAIADAIQNTLDIELTDAHLHGLLLADWNKSVNLQAASQYGKEKSVEEGMNALEDLTKALSSEE